MISAIYASISALIICWLSLTVIKLRHKHLISIGDGDIQTLKIARATHTNAIEYIPISLILLFALEYNSANVWLIHLLGIALITGRVIHARSFLADNIKGRVLGMQITIYTIIGLSIANVVYLTLSKFS